MSIDRQNSSRNRGCRRHTCIRCSFILAVGRFDKLFTSVFVKINLFIPVRVAIDHRIRCKVEMFRVVNEHVMRIIESFVQTYRNAVWTASTQPKPKLSKREIQLASDAISAISRTVSTAIIGQDYWVGIVTKLRFLALMPNSWVGGEDAYPVIQNRCNRCEFRRFFLGSGCIDRPQTEWLPIRRPVSDRCKFASPDLASDASSSAGAINSETAEVVTTVWGTFAVETGSLERPMPKSVRAHDFNSLSRVQILGRPRRIGNHTHMDTGSKHFCEWVLPVDSEA